MAETSISALRAATERHGTVANNIANSNTIAYKSERALFSSLVAGVSRYGSFTPGGVRATISRDTNQQGLLKSTNQVTDLGIAGKGMFAYGQYSAPTGKNTFAFSRSGQLVLDKSGNLVNQSNNWFIQGHKLDTATGLPISQATGSLDSLETVNINYAKQLAAPKQTDSISGATNLPSSDANATVRVTSMSVYDVLGEIHEVTFTWTKASSSPNNEWDLTIGAVDANAITKTNAAGAAYTNVRVVFDGTGKPTSFDGGTAMPDIHIDWNNAAADSTITLDLGQVNAIGGITCNSGTFDDSGLIANGKEVGKFSRLGISDDGTVTAIYTNGETLDIFKIPLIDFPASYRLSMVSGNLFMQSGEGTGDYVLADAGTEGMGTVESKALEQSTVDLAEQLTLMMENQRFYSSNTSVLKGYDDMFQELKMLRR